MAFYIYFKGGCYMIHIIRHTVQSKVKENMGQEYG